MGQEVDKFAAINEKFEALRKELRTIGKSATQEALKEFFDAYPAVKAVRWTQYTPYFMDGDACEFSINEPQVLLSDDEEGDYLESSELDNYMPPENVAEAQRLMYPPDGVAVNFKGGWNNTNYSSAGATEARKFRTWHSGASKELEDDLNRLAKLLQNAEEALEAAFGDHAKITATRENIEIEEYEHD